MDFIKGMDVSSYQEMLDKGYIYHDEKGNVVDILEYAVKKGFNYGRIRIWNEPKNIPESGGYCDFESTIKLAKKMKALGIPYLLDFHYSDWWADPGNQTKPLAWLYFHGEELQNAVYEYTKNVIDALSIASVPPKMVQIGNEIRCGMLWPDGNAEDYRELSKLINAGIKGVRDSVNGDDIQIMLHLDQGGRYHYYEQWFDGIIRCGVSDFDIIGLSYYPFWHGTYKDLDDTMNKLASRYGKEIVVAETAYGHRLGADTLFGKGQERLGGFSASPEGQKKSLQIISGLIAGVKDDKGLGFFYWEPFMKSEDPSSWGYCMGIVDENGFPLCALKDLDNNVLIDVETARNMYSELSYGADVEIINGVDIIEDAVWDKEMKEWEFSQPSNISYTINTTHEGAIFKFQGKGNTKFSIEKEIDIIEYGRYSLVVDYRGDNTTGVSVKPYVKFNNYTRETNIYPSDKLWTRGIITDEIAGDSTIRIGIEIDSPEIWGEIKQMHLIKGENQ